MAGLVHQGPHPQPWDQETNPVPIIGKGTSWEFTPEQSWTYLHPEPPQGYNNWTDYVVDVYDAQRRGQDLPYDADQSAAGWLQHSIGYGKLAPLVDSSNPKVSAFLDSLYTNSTGVDTGNSLFSGMFFPALAALGIVGGATALAGLGAGAAGAGAGAAEAAGAGLGAGAGEVAGAGALGGTTGLGGLAGAAAPAVGTGAAGAGAAGAGGLLSALGIAAPTTPLGWASLVGSGISGLGSLVGGIQGASAAKSAANTQAQSAQDANKLLADIYTQQRTDLAPYQALGTASLGDLMRRIQTNQQAPVQSFNLGNYRR